MQNTYIWAVNLVIIAALGTSKDNNDVTENTLIRKKNEYKY